MFIGGFARPTVQTQAFLPGEVGSPPSGHELHGGYMHNMTLDNSHLFTDITRGEQQLFSTMKVMSWCSHLILPITRIIHFLLQGMVHHGVWNIPRLITRINTKLPS
ncbi:uncharacterized protein LOC125859932 [Solanum stenotomum]|uniref:uncharacterized protein LOC125859932 n=1 Tax=Solanum stenotomum TaxID=172797 RepID=UPI0020D048C3|nr:uncharacterized protein LOC125859932 [Solanum stenotomum]